MVEQRIARFNLQVALITHSKLEAVFNKIVLGAPAEVRHESVGVALAAVDVCANLYFVHCLVEHLFRGAKHLVESFDTEFESVQGHSLEQVVDVGASHHHKVLAHHQVEESSSAGVVQIVVLEVVPKAGLDYVVILDEVFEDVLNINQPFSKLLKGGGRVAQVGLRIDTLKLGLAQLGQFAPAGGPQHALDKIGLGFDIPACKETVDLPARLVDRAV